MWLGPGMTGLGPWLYTHDATLRALAVLRVLLLKSFSAFPYLQMLRLRGAEVLNRLTLVLGFLLIWALAVQYRKHP